MGSVERCDRISQAQVSRAGRSALLAVCRMQNCCSTPASDESMVSQQRPKAPYHCMLFLGPRDMGMVDRSNMTFQV